MTAPDPGDKKTILVVEDSKMFSRILTNSIESEPAFRVVVAETQAQMIGLLESGRYEFFASLLDLNLPDAPDGEVIDQALAYAIPSIVFTGKFDDDLRDRLLSKGIVDYVVKEGPANVDYVVTLLKQLLRNTQLKVLVVDDSKTARLHLARLLNIYRFNVLEAENGEQALNVLDDNKDICLMITDFNMPKMDGFDLTKRVRNLYSKQDMAIIGMSTYGNNLLSAKFLKIGGSDFINKPFLEEEFFCRVNQNLDLLEYIKNLKFIASRDFLTGLYNRQHFFDVGEKLFSRAYRMQKATVVALTDIDYFKKINDTYGHDIGDLVLKKVGAMLKASFRATDLVARYGGEEFCFLLPNIEPGQAQGIFEAIRRKIESELLVLPGGEILQITTSIGVCSSLEPSLEEALSKADKMLYQAKRNGRNQVMLI
ncbi:diguanylate cyclase (GGDEF) domain-containing protein [Methylomagnum ishizawai]|uniref:diguanylate cyclase n=1 Tax=Methylomagnum ishizawai TaxID=1760988 RepID=A0A1Y6D415_9GAMM|nr:diguanylate cyclase [Methylomagnum ishizawai]SMF97678.1 diguanylate cyclase (GGDEF) domain-containing protein [Methylomagnum ishizawai]